MKLTSICLTNKIIIRFSKEKASPDIILETVHLNYGVYKNQEALLYLTFI